MFNLIMACLSGILIGLFLFIILHNFEAKANIRYISSLSENKIRSISNTVLNNISSPTDDVILTIEACYDVLFNNSNSDKEAISKAIDILQAITGASDMKEIITTANSIINIYYGYRR